MKKTLCAITTVFLLAPAAPGSEVRAHLQAPLTFDDTPVLLQVDIVNPTSDLMRPVLDRVDGLTIEGPGGPQVTTQTVNRVTTRYDRYAFRIRPGPGRTGTFTIGPVRVPRRSGRPLTSNAVTLKVCRRPERGVLFECAAYPAGMRSVDPVKEVRIGVPFRVVYTILYSGEPMGSERRDPFDTGMGIFDRSRYPFGLKVLNVPLTRRPDLKMQPILVDPDSRASPVMIADKTQIALQAGFAERDGFGYQTYRFGFEVMATAPGELDIGGASVTMELVVGTREVRDRFFGRVYEVPVAEGSSARTGPVLLKVMELPDKGRPAGFSGAIGRFTVEARTKDTEVDAKAPIRLDLTVRGEGLLKEAPPPAWSEIEVLTRDFEVATDIDAGSFNEGSNSKVFRQVIRPKSAGVTQIPAIPFPFYDPAEGGYRIAYTKPIPINVRAVKTVGGADVISARRPEPATKAVSPISPRAGIGANFAEIGRRTTLSPADRLKTTPFGLALVLPPAIFVLALLLRRWRRRDPEELRARTAFPRARKAMRQDRPDPDTVCRIYQDYFRERFRLGPGELTSGDLGALLRERGIPPETARRASSHFDRLLAARFGRSGEMSELVDGALAAISEVERSRR